MRKIIDFEIHSKYSRACSPQLNLPNIGAWANRKGVDVVVQEILPIQSGSLRSKGFKKKQATDC